MSKLRLFASWAPLPYAVEYHLKDSCLSHYVYDTLQPIHPKQTHFDRAKNVAEAKSREGWHACVFNIKSGRVLKRYAP